MKKVFIKSDMEGVTGVAFWDEVDKSKKEYEEFRKILTSEINVICDTIGDEAEIFLKDAHWTGKNILIDDLNENVIVNRGFSKGIGTGIDNTYDISILHGYHTAGGKNTNPISHTINDEVISYIKINGKIIGETTLDMYEDAYFKVPTIYISGDEGAVKEARELSPNIGATITKIGIGDSVCSKSPKRVYKEIAQDLKQALMTFDNDKDIFKIKLPTEFDVEINYIFHQDAYKASFYPKARLIDDKSVQFKTDDYKEVLRFLLFGIRYPV
jgi:D-amino peptidase